MRNASWKAVSDGGCIRKERLRRARRQGKRTRGLKTPGNGKRKEEKKTNNNTCLKRVKSLQVQGKGGNSLAASGYYGGRREY